MKVPPGVLDTQPTYHALSDIGHAGTPGVLDTQPTYLLPSWDVLVISGCGSTDVLVQNLQQLVLLLPCTREGLLHLTEAFG